MVLRIPYKTLSLSLAAIATLVFLAWLSTGWLDGPWGMIPGGALSGDVASCTDVDWSAYAAAGEIEVEIQPTSPRSLTTWSVVIGGELFIPADFLTPWKRWPHEVLQNPRVRLRIGGAGVFECNAERVEDADRIQQLRLAIAEKYGLQPDGRAARIDVWWFRIVPR